MCTSLSFIHGSLFVRMAEYKDFLFSMHRCFQYLYFRSGKSCQPVACIPGCNLISDRNDVHVTCLHMNHDSYKLQWQKRIPYIWKAFSSFFFWLVRVGWQGNFYSIQEFNWMFLSHKFSV